MAGIGFELRRAVRSPDPGRRVNGVLSAAFSSFGAMLIGILALLLLQLAGRRAGLEKTERDLFMTYVTHSMFLSMLSVSVFSLAQSRHLSDAIYEDRTERVMPALSGALALSLLTALPLMGLLLALSGTAWQTAALILALTGTLCACWILMNDLSLVRDYRQIVRAFCVSLAVTVIAIFIMEQSGAVSIRAMLVVVLISYSVVDVWLYRAIDRAFPQDSGAPFAFLGSLRATPALGFIGFLSMASLLGHFFVAWHMNGTAMEGLFRLNLAYDFPAIAAYLTTIPTTVYFIVQFEPAFCEHYHAYLDSLGHGGGAAQVAQRRWEMIASIRKGLRNTQAIQVVSAVLAVTAGAKLLDVLNIGMTEEMLSRYRIFCVAYALYAIANIVMLLQLYFMNERRAAWSALMFTAAAIGLTAAEIRLSGSVTGLPFAVASAMYLLVCLTQLVRCLNHLEHHILCCIDYADARAPRLNLRQMELSLRSRPAGSRSAVVGGCAFVSAMMILVSGVFLWQDADRASRITVTTPVLSDEVLLSPWMGYAPWANSDEGEATASTLVYVELRWADWEPEEGVFDTEFVEREYRLETYREQGRKVVFRFICDEPTEEEHVDIPAWLFGKTGDGDWYHNEYGYGYSPNYENETLIEAHARAIAALGEAYGGDAFFAFVEIGSIGHWGEYHVNYEVGIRRLPIYDTRLRYVLPYFAAFPHAKFMTRYPLLETRKYGLGLYNDMTGNYEETEYWLAQMQGGVWEQTELPEQADCADNWKTSPIGGEFAPTHPAQYFLAAELDNTLELLQRSHQSFIGPNIIVNESEEDFHAASDAILKTLGYRYVIHEVTVDQTDAEKIAFRLVWRNDGVAPVYEDVTLHLCIQEQGGGQPLWQADAPLQLRQLTGAETLASSAEAQKELMDDDTVYQLMARVTAGEEELALPLALAGVTEDGWYPIATFMIR